MGIGRIGSANVAALSGLRARGVAMQVSAENVANVSNDNYTPKRANYRSSGPGVTVSISAEGMARSKGGQGVELAREAVDQKMTKAGYQANIAAIKTQDEMTEAALELLS